MADTPRPGSADDRRLLRRIAWGDVQALTALYDRYADALFGHALWRTGRRQDAEDLVHDLFVKLAERGAALALVREPRAYLHRMLRNDAVARRKGAPPSTVELDEGIMVTTGESPARAAEASRLLLRLTRLPDEQRVVVALHLLEGWSFREIANAEHVPLFTIASRYRLALQRLRREAGVETP